MPLSMKVSQQHAACSVFLYPRWVLEWEPLEELDEQEETSEDEEEEDEL